MLADTSRMCVCARNVYPYMNVAPFVPGRERDNKAAAVFLYSGRKLIYCAILAWKWSKSVMYYWPMYVHVCVCICI
jgi:hypothetical protein